MLNLTPDRRQYTDAELRKAIEDCAYWALSEGGLDSRSEFDDIMAAVDALIERARPVQKIGWDPEGNMIELPIPRVDP